MWRESLGTAIGLVHARAKGRIVVVVDPNHLENPFLAFYADVVVSTLKEGVHATLGLLKSTTFSVLKHGGRGIEPFNREKLVESVRAAAHGTRKNDMTVPSLVLRYVTDALAQTGRRVGGQITTTDIEWYVLEALANLEANPEHAAAVAGIAEHWQKKAKAKSGAAARVTPRSPESSVSQRVPIYTSKSHGSIWGTGIRSADDIPAPARAVIVQITNAPGVSQLRLQSFGRGPKRRGVCAHVSRPAADGSIYGYVVDPQGKKGQKQSFSATVLQRGTEEKVYQTIVSRLKAHGCWLADAGD
jgi:hypothetical protein